MKKTALSLWVLSVSILNSFSWAVDPFPMGPDASLTPGALCTHPDAYRYPERIPYCNRDVSSGTKNQIIRDYDQKLGYRVGSMNRGDFKIDHYIPLCMGGANIEDNLWPQHKTVYQKTDALEAATCQKMAQGRLLQAEAIEIIKRAKANLDSADELLEEVQSR